LVLKTQNHLLTLIAYKTKITRLVMNENTQKRVLQILGKITGKDYSNVNLDGDLSSQLCLDSIQMVDLFAALEMEFNIELPLSMMNAKTGTEFLDMLDASIQDAVA